MSRIKQCYAPYTGRPVIFIRLYRPEWVFVFGSIAVAVVLWAAGVI